MKHVLINTNQSVGHINKNIYGQFSEHLGRCIYQGIYVGESSDIPNTSGMRNDVIHALKQLNIPVLRWPGGCFADTYHWMDGIGPTSNRKTIVNTYWGGETEDNSFGTHEFMELTRQLGCDAYISGNVGSGSVQEFSDWVEYCNMGGISPMADLRRKHGQEEPWNIRYWGIGNESWGGGGNMRPEYYADLLRHYATFIRSYSPDQSLYKIASGADAKDYHWTKTVIERAGHMIDAISLHYYTIPGPDIEHKGDAVAFDRRDYYATISKTLFMEELIANHSAIIRQYQKNKPIDLCIDEWGTWYDVEKGTKPGFLYQQNTMRDALVAAVNLNIFNNHCDTVAMSNIAQMVNVLQAMILTRNDQMLLTPTYHVFEMYKKHQNSKQIESYAEISSIECEGYHIPDLHVSSSEASDGSICISIANLDEQKPQSIDVILGGMKAASVKGRTLSGCVEAHNTFDSPLCVSPRTLDTQLTTTGFSTSLPPSSVSVFEVFPM